ncbi:MAG: LuxR family transcriptional regulator [Mesorhizobium sp.]|uniref:helix-turn-helix transcriptional regulator n=2 Tax=unclassified Mesorhizobium TaxID=325217 RepID=UPI000FE2EC4A|nr:LuxR family transcriptional regulator [Mesorhizobium sp.]RWK24258.1 MAG: LuxR family transcriptional regulator [Mesorhizobium sp.]RWK33221.1 MAG: LuxR family transcriptional regulator [Mesorhizobium sp.]
MHRVFETLVEQLSASVDAVDLHEAMASAAAGFDFPFFAYFTYPSASGDTPRLISNYPSSWTSHYLQQRYHSVDPVILRGLRGWDTFDWGVDRDHRYLPTSQQEVLEKAAEFGIRGGLTMSMHDHRGRFAALTFASNEAHPPFLRSLTRYEKAMQLVAINVHIHARRRLAEDCVVDGIMLTRREFECLKWAACGKSAWDISQILGVSKRTVTFHQENAKAKLGVRTINQAIVRMAARARS